jgi:sugar lactone lactonase YvrE
MLVFSLVLTACGGGDTSGGMFAAIGDGANGITAGGSTTNGSTPKDRAVDGTPTQVSPGALLLSIARFNKPTGIASDSNGNLYIADTGNHTIRKIVQGKFVITIAGSPGSPGSADGIGAAARFDMPSGIVVDRNGNVYVADRLNHTIRKITADGVVTTIAGTPGQFGWDDRSGSLARFHYPTDITLDAMGNMYIADTDNAAIRKITKAGVISTLARGDTHAMDSREISGPKGIAVDADGNVYITDGMRYTPFGPKEPFNYNPLVRKYTASTGLVSIIAGIPGYTGFKDGPGSVAGFVRPLGMVIDTANNLYLADSGNHDIRTIDCACNVSTLAGSIHPFGYAVSGTEDGIGGAARFNNPSGVALDASADLYVTDTDNNTIRKVTKAGVVTTFAGKAGEAGSTDVPQP